MRFDRRRCQVPVSLVEFGEPTEHDVYGQGNVSSLLVVLRVLRTCEDAGGYRPGIGERVDLFGELTKWNVVVLRTRKQQHVGPNSA